MTIQEQAKRHLPFIEAAADGKDIEYHSPLVGWRCADWHEIANCPPGEIRIKPQPKLRHWTNQEVPMPCILKAGDFVYSPVEYQPDGIVIVSTSPNGISSSQSKLSFAKLASDWNYSTDGGKTWLPCGVLEVA